MASNGRGGGDIHSTSETDEPAAGRWAGDRIAVIGDYADDGDLDVPFAFPASRTYEICSDAECKDVTALVRPVLAAEFGVEYYEEPYRLRTANGDTTRFSLWRRRRDPKASFSILDE